MMNRPSLIPAAADVLQQGTGFLNTVSQEQFSQSTDNGAGSSLGAHYRHVLDHFVCLLEGVRTGEINYDNRARNRLLETSREYAMSMTLKLIDEFRAMPLEVMSRKCDVTYSVEYGASSEVVVPTTFARELMFCVGHAIHHYAIVKLLCAGLGIRLPYEFGVAPSTIKYLESQTVSG